MGMGRISMEERGMRNQENHWGGEGELESILGVVGLQ